MIPLGSLSELFGKDFPGPFCLEKSFPKSLGNNPKGSSPPKTKFSSQRRLAMIPCLTVRCSGVPRGVAEATPIIQFLFNKFGQKIRVKKILFTAGYTNFKILPTSLVFRTSSY